MTGGKIKPKNDIPLPFKIGGTWDAPRISGFDVGALVKAIFGEQISAIVDKGKDAIEDALQGEKDKAKDAARAEADKVKDKAREEAARVKKKAKEKAKAEADRAKDKAKDALGGSERPSASIDDATAIRWRRRVWPARSRMTVDVGKMGVVG